MGSGQWQALSEKQAFDLRTEGREGTGVRKARQRGKRGRKKAGGFVGEKDVPRVGLSDTKQGWTGAEVTQGPWALVSSNFILSGRATRRV